MSESTTKIVILIGGSIEQGAILAAIIAARALHPGQTVEAVDYIVTADDDNEATFDLSAAVKLFQELAPESDDIALYVRAYAGPGAAGHEESALIWQEEAVRICARDKLGKS